MRAGWRKQNGIQSCSLWDLVGSFAVFLRFRKHPFDLLLKFLLCLGVSLFDSPLIESQVLLQGQAFGLIH